MPELSRRNWMKSSVGGIALGIGGTTITTTQADAATTPDLFDAWIAMRGGEERPAFWYSEGLIRPIKKWGEVESRMIGMETWITPAELRTATSAVSISRKIYFFLDPGEDEIVLDAATGRPRRPSIFAYQVRRFDLVDGAIQYRVESHDLRGIRQGGFGVTYTVSRLGDQVHVNYASFPRRPDTAGELQVTSGEVYDYFDNGPSISETPKRFQMSWVGTNLEGNIANQRGWRFDAFDDIPNGWLKSIIMDKAPMWTAPPRDMAEIDNLREQVPFKVPGLNL